MKKLTIISTVGLMLATASLHAQVNLYITGSTAFRSQAYRAVTNMFGANLQNANAGNGSFPTTGSNRATYRGTIPSLFGSQLVTVYTDYGGSIQGVKSLANNEDQIFFANPTNSPTDNTLFTNKANLAFSDVFQDSTDFGTGAGFSGLVDLQLDPNSPGIAIQPFAIVKSSASILNTVSNITDQQMLAFLPLGKIQLSMFTGNTNDTTLIYLPGRSKDSGTRLTIDYDTLLAPGGTEKVYTNTAPGVFVPVADQNTQGYSSGGGIVSVLASSANSAISYLGLADSASVSPTGANTINYQGQKPFKGSFGNTSTTTNDYTPVITGQYSYWSYEHLFEKSGTLPTADINKYATNLLTFIDADITTIHPNYVLSVKDMKVRRSTDGAPITP